MITLQIGSELSFWVCSTSKIEHILAVLRILVNAAQNEGYTASKSWAGGGVHERDTGYEDFTAAYPTFDQMEAKLCDDFSQAEGDLDGLWFDTLNFESIVVHLVRKEEEGHLSYSRGIVRLSCDNEAEIYKQCLPELEPFIFQERKPDKRDPSRLSAEEETKKVNDSTTKTNEQKEEKTEEKPLHTENQKPDMLSQLAAKAELNGSSADGDRYIMELKKLGFSNEQAERLLQVERDIIRRFGKRYLLESNFDQAWFMGLQHPFFEKYPKTMDDVKKERFFTISEVAKFIDEAEWHFWNSHERDLPQGVFEEISTWRLRGKGGDFGIQYCQEISQETGIPIELFAKYFSHEANHLNKYKWGQIAR